MNTSSQVSAVVSENAPSNTVQSGIILPSDIRIRLVRAEAASLDTILSLLYSTVLSIFSLFLGIVLTKGSTCTTTEIAAVVCFGILSCFLLGWWLYIKWKQSEKGVSVPHTVLQQFDN
jgi:hypothetical protein